MREVREYSGYALCCSAGPDLVGLIASGLATNTEMETYNFHIKSNV